MLLVLLFVFWVLHNYLALRSLLLVFSCSCVSSIYSSSSVTSPFFFLQCIKGEAGASGIPGADGRAGHPVSHNTDSTH